MKVCFLQRRYESSDWNTKMHTRLYNLVSKWECDNAMQREDKQIMRIGCEKLHWVHDDT